MASIAGVAPSFLGEFGNYNGKLGVTFSKILKLSATQLVNWWSVLNATITCIRQYAFAT